MREAAGQSTLGELIRGMAETRPDRVAITFVTDDSPEGDLRLTYGELSDRSGAVGAAVADRSAAGDRALIMCPPGPDYVAALLGCMRVGVVPVPIYPPASLVPGRAIARLRAVTADVGASLVLTTSVYDGVPGDVADLTLDWIMADTVDPTRSASPVCTGPDDVAFVQYTSGSTSDPKGVVLRNRNVTANLEMIRTAYSLSSESTVVSWLPPFHDMGLIGGIVTPLGLGASTVLMAPNFFLRRPLRWLQAIARFRAAMSPAPDFAYRLCAEKAEGVDLSGLDLSSWSCAISGAEPIRPDTLRRFCATFESAGFRPSAFFPSYGMAETVVLISAGPPGPATTTVDARQLGMHRVVAADPTQSDARELVISGRPAQGSSVRIVDPETRLTVPPGSIGEIWVSGPHVGAEYRGRPEESESVFRARTADEGDSGPWLRTGDLGFLHDGAIVVTGRRKDLVIVRGMNLYPQDLEAVAERADPLARPGTGVAFTVDVGGTERLVIVQALAVRSGGVDEERLSSAALAIVGAVTEEMGVRPDLVILVVPKHVAKTTSGKVQRSAVRQAYLTGRLPALHEWRASDWAGTPAPTGAPS